MTVAINENLLVALQGTYSIFVRETDISDAANYVDSVIELNVVEILDCIPVTFVPPTVDEGYTYFIDEDAGTSNPLTITFPGAVYGDCEFTSTASYACDSCG